MQRVARSVSAVALSLALCAGSASAKYESVNRPDMLPPGDMTTVIDVAGFLSAGQEARIKKEIAGLEADTGIKIRLLAQNYPDTPGLAIKDYWGVDGDTVVFVADPTFGGMLNFSVGENVDLSVPRNFWSRLNGKYGTKFYVRDNGEDTAIVNAISAIDTCLREPQGKNQCAKIQGELGEEPSSGPFGWLK